MTIVSSPFVFYPNELNPTQKVPRISPRAVSNRPVCQTRVPSRRTLWDLAPPPPHLTSLYHPPPPCSSFISMLKLKWHFDFITYPDLPTFCPAGHGGSVAAVETGDAAGARADTGQLCAQQWRRAHPNSRPKETSRAFE